MNSKPLTPLSTEDFFPFDDFNSHDSLNPLNPFSSVDLLSEEPSFLHESLGGIKGNSHSLRENGTDSAPMDINVRTPTSGLLPPLIPSSYSSLPPALTLPSSPPASSFGFSSSFPTTPVLSSSLQSTLPSSSSPLSDPRSVAPMSISSPSISPGNSRRSSPTNKYSKIKTPKQHASPSPADISSVDAEIRRRKHNQAEKRRRNKIKETFKELASLVECSRTQKSTILRSAIDKVQSLQQRVRALKLENDDLRRQNDQQRKQLLSASTSVSSSGLSGTATPSFPHAHTSLRPSSGAGVPQFLEPPDAKKSPSISQPGPGGHQSQSQSQSSMGKFVSPMNSTGSSSNSIHQTTTQQIGLLFFQSGLPMLISALSGKIIDCNELFAQLLGYQREFLLKAETTTFQITHPDSLATSFVLVSNLLTNPNRSQRITKRYITKSGLILPTEMVCWISSNQSGQPEYINAIVEPIEEEEAIEDL